MKATLPTAITSVLTCLLILTTTTHASTENHLRNVYETGNHLLRDLRDATGTGFGPTYALGYIVGAADAYGGSALCIPGTVTKGQINDVVRQFLEQEPGIRDLPADILVLMALSNHWACPKGRGKEKKRS
jgi:hypothetical protein